MVNASDRKNGDDAFVKSVRTKMEEGLKQFVQKVYKHRVGQKPKKQSIKTGITLRWTISSAF